MAIAVVLLALTPAGVAAQTTQQAAQATQVSPRTLLVLGDSLSAEYGLARGSGWVALLGQRLAASHPGWTIVNASISGETTAGGASRIATLLERHRPALVIVELGGNDALRGLDLKASRANLDRIVEVSRKADAEVLLLGMQVPPNYGKAYTEAFARLYRELADARQLALVPFFLDGVAEDPNLFQPDRIHPNAQAQPRMLETVWPILERLLAPASG
jgi:acyl-CoA thioesterase-1